MPRAAYGRKGLLEITGSDSESMTIMVGALVAGKQAGRVLEQ